ncbi:AlpA family transcriptional regulator [Ferrovum myxofaciens]|uniref:AlpA family transcriptional regulator n=1 Tax=Ferrovum myxofaciens TaxID=416213 RepID=UPI0004E1D7DF|nr:AlpA family transcriptional regulator [Ferrovum myxofaciens]
MELENVSQPHPRILRLPQVMDRTALSRSTIYQYMSEGEFPESVGLGSRAVGWVEGEINDWLQTKIQQREEVH